MKMSERDYEYDADASFDAAVKTMRRFVEDHKSEGPMANVSLARALGAVLVLTTKIGERDDMLATAISQLCDTFSGLLILEQGDE
jgi:hypothetical protein